MIQSRDFMFVPHALFCRSITGPRRCRHSPMPSSTRKSSGGPNNPRRGPQKAHIPFRADDLEHGKKTGIAVTYVAHGSDGFEPFSEIMMQADGRTPVAGRNKNQKSTDGGEQDEGDEDGEMSMELDDSTLLFYSHRNIV